MSRKTQLNIIKGHLESRYRKLIEKSASYRIIDEMESDNAAFKAMKIKEKLNRVDYLNHDVLIR
ncbi:MAG: hypothetical protein HWD85_10225 [Flavobacteriaceae bacterium]|nr:hypothetical protein [Flavobacteriaceae bacterium]